MAMDEKRARLLDAAGHEFAEKGFEGATVRSISERAGVNLAAINYHFGDKERLYEAVLLLAHRSRPAVDSDPPEMDPRESLRRFITHFLESVAFQESAPWHQAVMVRELAAPSKASDTLVRDAIRPHFDRLAAIVRRLCPATDERRLHAVTFSIVAQCLHYKISRAISERIIGVAAFRDLDAGYLATHITDFTLAALGQGPPLSGQNEREWTRTNPTFPESDR